jgi:predicted transcriptional regulator YdeE
MEPKFARKGAFNLIGIEARTSNHLEMNPETAQIPGLWGRFFQQNISARILVKTDSESILGVYTNYESDYTAPYSLIVAREVENLDGIPDGMVGLRVPDQEYLVFAARGPMPQSLIAAWSTIWDYFSSSPDYERAYTADFEEHRADGTEIDIYIAVKKR